MNTSTNEAIEAALREFCDKTRELADHVDRLRTQLAGKFDALPATVAVEPASTAGDAWTAKRAAEFLGLSESSVYKKAESGDLPSIKLGRRRVFDPSAMAAWRAKHQAVEATPASVNRRVGDP